MATDDSTDPAVRTHGGEPVRYVVVVHGMGEQRRSASRVDIILWFAEATRTLLPVRTESRESLHLAGADWAWIAKDAMRECPEPA